MKKARFDSLVTVCIGLVCVTSLQAKIVVTDILDRNVTLAKPAQRLLLGEGRFLAAIGILEQERPIDKIAGMMGDFKLYDPDGYNQYVAAFPALAKVPLFGRGSEETVSLERMIALNPDAAILGIQSGHGPSSKSQELLSVLQAADIKVVFIDFRQDPLINTPQSIAILGTLLGREAKADAFIAFYQEQLARVVQPLQDYAGPRPTVFVEKHVGLTEECCGTMKGLMGSFIGVAGGHNIAETVLIGDAGLVHPEYLLTHQPDIYVGTAIGNLATQRSDSYRIMLGAGVGSNVAQASFKRALTRPYISELTAVKQGRVMAIWHHFYNSPLNVAAVQALAKVIHRDLFADLNPHQTLVSLYDRFQPVDCTGVFWTELE